MYCPNCGKENPEARRFCRSCGLSLQAITPALAGESPIPSVEESSVEPLGRIQAAWQNPLIYALLLIIFGVIMGAVSEKGAQKPNGARHWDDNCAAGSRVAWVEGRDADCGAASSGGSCQAC